MSAQYRPPHPIRWRERVECFERDKDALEIFTKCWGESNFAYIDENGEMQYCDSDELESEDI